MTFIADENIARRVGSLIRLLSSPNDGEALGAARGLVRALESAGTDIHELATHIEKPNGDGPTEAAMRQIYDAAYAAGVQAAENRHHGAGDFHNADGKPNWEAVALFLQRNKSLLDSKHHEFIDDMASRTVWGREPTEKQHRYLHSIFYKLGGKIT
jgi:hypothetical protein